MLAAKYRFQPVSGGIGSTRSILDTTEIAATSDSENGWRTVLALCNMVYWMYVHVMVGMGHASRLPKSSKPR